MSKRDNIIQQVPTAVKLPAVKLPGVDVTVKEISEITEYVTIIEDLGQGSFASVSKVKLLKPIVAPNGKTIDAGTEVALKIQKMKMKSFDLVAQEINTLRLAMELNCPNINQIYDVLYDSKNRVLYFILELINGHDLFDIQHKSPLFEKLHEAVRNGDDPTKAVRESSIMGNIILPLLYALQCLHKNNIAHRDIKSENIMITKDVNGKETAMFIDFGLSCVNKCGVNIIGTPETIAPEIYANKVDYQNVQSWINADYWALGCVIYELITNVIYPPQQQITDAYIKNNNVKHVFTKLTKYPILDAIPIQYPHIKRILNILMTLDPKKRKPILK